MASNIIFITSCYLLGNKTANIYAKNCSVYIQCKSDIVVIDIKQQNHTLKIQTLQLHSQQSSSDIVTMDHP